MNSRQAKRTFQKANKKAQYMIAKILLKKIPELNIGKTNLQEFLE